MRLGKRERKQARLAGEKRLSIITANLSKAKPSNLPTSEIHLNADSIASLKTQAKSVTQGAIKGTKEYKPKTYKRFGIK